MNRKEWLIIILLFVIVTAVESVGVYQYFTKSTLGGNDFYSRWAGAEALLIDGRDPYSLEVTAEIQVQKGIDPALEGKGSFAYPLHVIFLFLPLAYVAYPLALAIWMVILQWVIVGTIVLLFQLFDWHPSLAGRTLLILGTIVMYPIARSILLGQFTLHVTLFLVLMLLLLKNGKDGWAGVCLAATSVKPQMVILLGIWFVIWAVAQRRWRFLWGVLAGGGAMFLTSLLFFPRWPISFIEDIQRYAPVAGGKNPLVVLVDQVLPGAGEPARWMLTAVLLAGMLWAWWRGTRGNEATFLTATYWTIVASLLLVFQTGTTNQALLLIPLFDWLARLKEQPFAPWHIVLITLGLIILPWILFINTVTGNAENPIMFLPLPLLSLLVLFTLTWANRHKLPIKNE